MKFNCKYDAFICEIDSFNFQTATAHDIAMLKKYLYKFKVLILKDQKLSEDNYERLINCLGKPIPHVLENFAVPGHRNIIKISNYIDAQGKQFGVLDGGAYWHSDMSYKPQLGIATALYCISTPAQGGETHFIDSVYGLSLLMKEEIILRKLTTQTKNKLSNIKITHRFGNRRKVDDPVQPEQITSDSQRSQLTDVIHSFIERHPVTGEQSLFSIAGTGIKIDNLNADDSVNLLNEIEDYVSDNSRCYRHKYSKGDVVIWDNMTTMHKGYEINPTRNELDCRLLYRMNFSYNKDDT